MKKLIDLLANNTQEPERRSRTQDPLNKRKKPEVIPLGIDVPLQGEYRTKTGLPRGCVVHYTAGRRGGEEAAYNLLRYLAKNGLGCLVMDEEGKIYKPTNQGQKDVAFHAGVSQWKGKKGISYHCLGMEIMCAGLLEENRAWFGKEYPLEQIRQSPAKDNIRAGNYLAFTPKQEQSLRDFLYWQMLTNPEFDVDWVVGHDEIAPGRKSDPGGSLSVTMPELRETLRAKQPTMYT